LILMRIVGGGEEWGRLETRQLDVNAVRRHVWRIDLMGD
jgi:hypothetical protein